MQLFKKKFDLQKDRLMKEFDFNSRKYILIKYENGQKLKINQDELNRQTKKYLEEQNKLLEDNSLMNQEIENYKRVRRFDELKQLGYYCNSFEVLNESSKGSMSNKMKQYMDQLLIQDDILLGIHRCSNPTTESITDMLTNGLQMTGHLGSGAGSINGVNLSDNVSYYPDNKTIVKELMYADFYKNSAGSLLIKIPMEDLKGDIYIRNKDGVRLNPKYILGYVPVYPNHHIEEILNKDEFIKRVNPEVKVNNTLQNNMIESTLEEEYHKTR